MKHALLAIAVALSGCSTPNLWHYAPDYRPGRMSGLSKSTARAQARQTVTPDTLTYPAYDAEFYTQFMNGELCRKSTHAKKIDK